MEMLNDSLKFDSVIKSFDQVREDASSILSLVQEMRNLEGSLELAKETLTKKEEELRKREQEVEIKATKVSEREDELDLKMVFARNEVEECNKILISKRAEHQECVDDLAVKRKQLGSLMKSIEDQSKKLKAEETKLGYKEKELSKVQKSIGEVSSDLQSKEKHLQSIKGMIRECSEKLEDKERKYKAMSSNMDKLSAEFTRKQKQFDLIRIEISKKNEELEAKTQQRDLVNNSISVCCAVLAEKEKELALVDKSINERSSKLQMEEKKLAAVESYTKELSITLELKDKDVREKTKKDCEDLELELNAVQESIKERNEELALKEKELKSVEMSILERSKELEAMRKQDILSEKSVTESSEELQSKKKHLDLVEKSSLECSDDHVSKESLKELEEKLEANQRKLELKDQKIDPMQELVDELSKKLDDKEKQLNDKLWSEVTVDVNSSTVDYQSCVAENGKYLQSLLNESYRKQDSVHNEVYKAIQNSQDPGKLVLDAMKEQDTEFDLSVIQRSCSTLLEKLLKMSPEIKPEVREAAKKLALEWKSKMKMPCENTLEVSVFLQLLAAFKVSSCCSHDELQSFLDVVHQNEALQLRQALGFAEGTGSVADLPLQANRQVADSSAAAVDDRAYLLVNERSCPLILEDNVMPDLIAHEVLLALQRSKDPAKFVFDLMNGSYMQHLKNGGVELEADVVRSEIMVMQQLNRFKLTISPIVKEGALKLATLWQKNVLRETVDGMEASAFLLFLYMYRLGYRFNSTDILGVLVKIAPHRHAPDLCRSLAFEDMIPKLISILLERKQYIDAARFSCAFRLLHVFPLDTIQRNCVEHLWRSAQDQAKENELAFLKALLHCVSEYRLENVYDTLSITRKIFELETERARSLASSLIPAVNVLPPLHSGNYFGVDINSSMNQPTLAPFVESQLQDRRSFSRDEASVQGCNKRPRNI